MHEVSATAVQDLAVEFSIAGSHVAARVRQEGRNGVHIAEAHVAAVLGFTKAGAVVTEGAEGHRGLWSTVRNQDDVDT